MILTLAIQTFGVEYSAYCRSAYGRPSHHHNWKLIDYCVGVLWPQSRAYGTAFGRAFPTPNPPSQPAKSTPHWRCSGVSDGSAIFSTNSRLGPILLPYLQHNWLLHRIYWHPFPRNLFPPGAMLWSSKALLPKNGRLSVPLPRKRSKEASEGGAQTGVALNIKRFACIPKKKYPGRFVKGPVQVSVPPVYSILG